MEFFSFLLDRLLVAISADRTKRKGKERKERLVEKKKREEPRIKGEEKRILENNGDEKRRKKLCTCYLL